MLMISNNVTTAMQNSQMGDYTKANETLANSREMVSDKIDWIIVISFFALVIGLLVLSYIVTANPIFAAFYLIAIIILGILAGLLQYTWESISQSSAFLTYLSSMPITNFLLTHLVLISVIVGLLSLILLYIGFSTRPV